MNISMLDQTREREQSEYGEAVRLSNELRFLPTGRFKIDSKGNRLNLPSRLWGFDIETADYSKVMSYFSPIVTKRSQSLTAFVNRVLSVRFPTEYHNDKRLRTRLVSEKEQELIQSVKKNEVEWFGEVGYHGKVRLDGSLG